MSAGHVVDVGFWSAFVIDILIVIYAFRLSKMMGSDGLLSKTAKFTGLAALVFGIHHILEVFLEHLTYGIAIAETVEGVAAILLLLAVYNLYKLVGGTNPDGSKNG